MSRDEERSRFIDANLDELVGLLLRSFAEARCQSTDPATDGAAGRAMRDKMNRARDYIGRLYDAATASPARPKDEAKPTLPITPARNRA